MPEEKNTSKKDEKIEVSKSEWDKVMARLATLEESKEEIEVVGADDDEPEVHYCHVAEYEGRPVDSVKRMVQVGIDEITKNGIMHCTVYTKEKDGTVKEHKDVDFALLTGQPTNTCKIEEIKRKKMTKKGDLVDEKFFNEQKNRFVETGRQVRLAVNYTEDIFVVDWKGEKVELSEVNVGKSGDKK